MTSSGKASSNPLAHFSASTRQWFTGAFTKPTPAQAGAWRAIAAGKHALVVAPTGSGKTLAAFLWALDQLHTKPPRPGTRVLYISPLKALGVDVERNLRAPLIGIAQTAQQMGVQPPQVRVGVRSGDTSAKERRALVANPPDILITTPESLYLMLTSQARSTLAQVDTVIIDEIHAIAGTKRGSHLAVSLERLDQLLDCPAQRIGLSATVEPIETVARFLGGSTPVEIVNPPSQKQWQLTVSVPVPDMTALGGPNTYGEGDNAFRNPDDFFDDGLELGDSLLDSQPPAEHIKIHPEEEQLKIPSSSGYQASIWPHIEERIVDLVEQNRSTIVFANSRGLAEKLTARLNEIYTGRLEAAGKLNLPPSQADHERLAPVLARAHHGSVSKDQRSLIEESLKSGQLRCVVATSSLELGIDMGAVDLVIQVESPYSVASGLQRVGRAGHRVGVVSCGWLYPKHRGDLLTAAVTVKRMLAGEIEPLTIPTNPLDILAQQTVAAAALGPIDVETWYEALRNTAPFATLPRSAYEATLNLLAGFYPSSEFAELCPRLVWNRDEGVLEPRPGAQRIAVTSGGTIPDRGLFPVYIVDSGDSTAPKRVGELDEEMVYESRAGDVIALGASSWRIEEITHDRVKVTPAPGVPGKLPFWHGEGPGRPLELGRALGAFTRDLAGAISGKKEKDKDAAAQGLRTLGLDTWATENTLAYISEQAEATGVVPSDTQLVVERFRDEIGDWRVVLHSPFGMPVHAPWALAVGQRVEELYGVNASAMAADDGVVLRIPAVEADPPGANLFLFDPDELQEIVTERVSTSALFTSRFRENAARALLLPRRSPGQRTPLWQQRQRSAQLLDVARKFKDFPIILETVRECLQDVYDLPALTHLHRRIDSQQLKVAEVETDTPSPFARTLLFGYVAQFLYEGDSPLAERRAAALSLDPVLLAELLGREEIRELLDTDVIRSLENRLQHTAAGYRYRGVEGVADLLRLLGPLTATGLAARLTETKDDAAPLEPAEAAHLAEELVATNRALKIQLRGVEHYAAIEDSAHLRDGLGVPLPIGVPLAFLEPAENPLQDLIGRYARTHAPFTSAQAATALGLGTAVVETTLQALATEKRVVSGEFLPEEIRAELAQARTGETGQPGTEWVDTEVLRTLRARSLAALRADVEPVAHHIYGRFLPDWQHLTSWDFTLETAPAGTYGLPEGSRTKLETNTSATLAGYDGLLTIIDQLAGVRLPASALEPLVLRSRLSDYSPDLLDRAVSAGDVLWAGEGELAGDGWVSLHLAEAAELTLPDATARAEALKELSDFDREVYKTLAAGGLFFPQIRQRLDTSETYSGSSSAEISAALWRLVWAGLVTNDTFAPVRALLAGGNSAHKLKKPAASARSALRRGASRLRASRLTGTQAGQGRYGASSTEQLTPLVSGRWSQLVAEHLDPTVAAAARAELLLDRYGVLTRGAVAAEDTPGGFSAVYRVLSAAEEQGVARRGYFIEELGAAQFSTANTVDRLREYNRAEENTGGANRTHHSVVLLAATDPANPYGAALNWPVAASFTANGQHTGHKPGRKAGAVVVLVDGRLVLYMERGGRTLLLFSDNPDVAATVAHPLAELVRSGAAEKVIIEKVNGLDILTSYGEYPEGSGQKHPVTALRSALQAAGFYSTPKGLRMRREV